MSERNTRHRGEPGGEAAAVASDAAGPSDADTERGDNSLRAADPQRGEGSQRGEAAERSERSERSGAAPGGAENAEGRPPPEPEDGDLLEAVQELSRELALERGEEAICEAFLNALAPRFPRRSLALRVFDARALEPARCYVRGGELRVGAESERVCLRPASAERAKLKTAIAASARVRIADTWDAPLRGAPRGLTLPLAAAGELYGVLDVGYPAGLAPPADERRLFPFAFQLAMALRNERLNRETSLLRDYQSTLIEQADALIICVDTDWRITVCNQALCRLSGYGHDEIVGTDVRRWMEEADRERLTRVLREAFATGGAEAIDVALVARSGKLVSTVWSVARISVRRDLHAVVAVGQDQTRLAELQSQVIQAEKLATLGQLAAGVVHELNNPLTSISVYADYLLKKVEARSDHPLAEPGDAEKLRRIGDGADRILAFARDLVQYAKPSGEEPEPVEIARVVTQSLSFCEHLFERSAIEREVQLPEDSLCVEAVPGQLEQVVINLVTNACHAAGERGRVFVGAERATEDGARLVIADDGPGVPERDRDHVFEPFFSTKTDGQGTGLGLSIVKSIVDQHEGAIRVDESTEGGARFTVWLPASRRARSPS